MQALRIEFTVMSASETNPQYRDFFLANCPSFQHVYESIEEQVQGSGPCILCKQAGMECEVGRDGLPQPVDLLVTGSPCDPFSRQRPKRFVTGDVRMHAAFDVTMSVLLDMYAKFSPNVGIMEQVLGFLMPMDSTTTETPYSRPGLSMVLQQL